MFAPISDTFVSIPDWVIGYQNNSLVMVPVTKGPGGPLPPGTGFGMGASVDLSGVLTQIASLNTLVGNQGNAIADLQTTSSQLVSEMSIANASIASLNATVSGFTGSLTTLQSSVDTLNTEYSAINGTVSGLSTNVTALLLGTDYQETVVPVTGDDSTDNSSVIQSFWGPTGSVVVGTNGVRSRIADAGVYVLKSLIDVDPQISLDMHARGGVVFVPDPHLPGIVPGTAGTGVATGGGGVGAMFRITRRAPGINKQAYEGLYGGFNIDGTGINTWDDNATCDAAGTFTSTNHARNVGDMVFFAQNPLGAALPAPLVAGDFTLATAYYIKSVPDANHFTVCFFTPGSATVVTAAGACTWTTNLYGYRLPTNDPSQNANDPDALFDNRKTYTAGSWRDMDVVGLSGSGFLIEKGNGRFHIHSVRSMNHRLYGFEINSNDKVFSGHWAAGGNGAFGVLTGAGTGIYANTGNVWGKPANRSVNCGAWYFRDTAFFAVSTTEFNDWVRLEAKSNFNNAGAFSGNMIHPHSENYSADGVAINVLNDGDTRLQSNFGILNYQGLVFSGNAWSRTENISKSGGVSSVNTATDFLTSNNHGLNNNNVIYMSGLNLPAPLVQGTQYFVRNKTTNTFQVSLSSGGSAIDITTAGSGSILWTTFPTYMNFGGATDGSTGTAPQWLIDMGGAAGSFGGTTPSMTQVFDGVCTAPDVKPWTGPFATGLSVAAGVLTWTAHPLFVGDRVRFTLGTYTNMTPDTTDYFVTATTTNTATLSASFGGATISTATASGATCVQCSAIPYNIHGGASGAGVYVDSYRGVVNLWQRGGTAGKMLIGTSKIKSWEGNPNYAVEIGDDKVNGSSVPTSSNLLYGLWNLDYAPQIRTAMLNRNAWSTGTTKNVPAYAQQFFLAPSGGAIASGTITLPPTMSSSYEVLIVIAGSVTAITWTITGPSALNAKSAPLPTGVTGWTAIRLEYLADNDEWNVVEVYGNEGYTAALGTTGALQADCTAGRNFLIGPLTGNCTISNPTHPQDGAVYTFLVKENATGGFTVGFGGKFRKVGSPAFTTTANAVNIFQAKYNLADDKFDIINFQAGLT